MQRRSFIGAILASGFAPAVARAGILMPIKPRSILTLDEIGRQYARELADSMTRTRQIVHVGIMGGFGGAIRGLVYPVPGALSYLPPGHLLPPGWDYVM